MKCRSTEKDSNKFALPSRHSFRHLYFSPDKRGKSAQEDVARALAKIAGQSEDSKLAASLADPFMFQDYYGDRVYWENFGKTRQDPVRILVGYSVFPMEIFRAFRRWAEKRYLNLVYCNRLGQRGHFAGLRATQAFR